MIFSLLLSVLFPVLFGLLLVEMLWSGPGRSSAGSVMKLSIGTGIGFGVSSLLFFVRLLSGVGFRPYLALEVLLLACAAIGVWFLRKHRGNAIREPGMGEIPAEPRIASFLRVCFYIALASTVAVSLIGAIVQPHGGWDACAIWNLRARFLSRGGEQWTRAFSPLLAHPDYPLLLPLSVARAWGFAGTETTVVPAVLSFVFTFGTVSLVVSSLSSVRGSTQGYLAGLALLGPRVLFRWDHSQLADVPVGFYLLSAVVLLFPGEGCAKENGKPGRIALAGLLVGFAAWTKNEGILFAATFLFTLFAVSLFSRNRGKELFFLGVGMIPVLAAVVYFKARFAPPSDLFVSRTAAGILAHIGDPERHLRIMGAFLRNALRFPVPALLVYVLCLGADPGKEGSRRILPLGFLLFAVVAGYYCIYLITPHDLQWHLDTSLVRLMLQLWPAAVYAFFLVVRSPDTAMRERHAS